MRRSSRGRADLVRALGQEQSALTAAMAALLGYQETAPVETPDIASSAAAPRASRKAAAVAPDLPYTPTDVPFWRLETYEALVREDTPPERRTTRTATDPAWRQRPQQAPKFTPLAPERTIRTRLRQVSAIRRATAEIDLDATAERLSRGELLRDVPRRTRRAWGTSLYIIEDRARRLVPYWLDQDIVTDMLQRLYPPHGVHIARLGDGESQPVLRWPEAQRGTYAFPAPHTLVVVLGDLGCLATQGASLRRFWLHWGRLLRANHNPAVALVPMRPQDVPPDLARLWTVVRWDAGGAGGVEGVAASSAATVQRLLTLLAPAIRLEPGLLRAVRCFLPEGQRDAGLEARLWQDAALRSQHSVAASLDLERREAALAQFMTQPERLRRQALEHIRAWRAQVHEEVWFAEVLSLAPEAQQTSLEVSDLEDAQRFLRAFPEALRQSGGATTEALAWGYRLTQYLAGTPVDNVEVQQALHALYELVRPLVDETHVPRWYDPALRPQEAQAVRCASLWQVADQVRLQVLEASAAVAPEAVPRGSPLGRLYTRGEVIMTPYQAPESANAFWDGGQPPAWAQAWGEDAYGAWVTFRYNEVEQRLRWIPSGHFLMGSPEDEAGRFSDEGPQHAVQITRGFWLFETPCTQALWQAVLGENPSQFQGAQRPVEQVSWRDCQIFLARLNAQLPGLELGLPTEAQWEYACRAGTASARYHEDVDAIAWHYENNHAETHDVRAKLPNAWGLYDMLGNVWEWCQDRRRTYTRHSVTDPVGSTAAGAYPALRGGGWDNHARYARAANRYGGHPGDRLADIGFRGASSSISQPARATWSASQRQAEPAKTATRSPAAQRCDVQQQPSASMDLPDSAGFILRTDREQLRFGRFTRPAWANEMGRDAYGLWAMFEVKSVQQRLRWIPPGRFLMGSPPDEAERLNNEGPQHEVCLTRGFWLFETPCTQALWQAVMGTNPSRFRGAQHPVEQVSWEDCQTFLQALNAQLPGLACGLPTEAQWEYACRAGTETARYAAELEAIAWYDDNSHGTTHAVGQKHANAWGLYDMLGNVLEWCHDGPREYQEELVVDPVGRTDAGADRALRGGSWGYLARGARAADRDGGHPGSRFASIGFRGASSA